MFTFVTTTAYGSWLPGDIRGWVQDGRTLSGNPKLEKYAATLVKDQAIRFTTDEQASLLTAILSASKEFRYHLTDIAIESSHLHWIIDHHDKIAVMVGRLKNRMRQALHRGRVWTAGYCANPLLNEASLHRARLYIGGHHGCRVSGSVPFRIPSAPGSVGGSD